jgi:hypothetical protein
LLNDFTQIGKEHKMKNILRCGVEIMGLALLAGALLSRRIAKVLLLLVRSQHLAWK